MDTGRIPAEILLVEDDRDVRDAIAEVLEEEGYAVPLMRSGVDAIRRLNDAGPLPAVILLDLMMPVMDGWEFWSVLQGNSRWARIPVVLISADTNVEQKANSLGAAAHLRKPMDVDELLSVLKRLVARLTPTKPIFLAPRESG